MKRILPVAAIGLVVALASCSELPSGPQTQVGGPVAAVTPITGGAFTTTYGGAGCPRSAVNCNIYDSKEDVWLNGGPTANGLGPDGMYFFAVLEPGGMANPNDGGASNLSKDAHTNRTFTVTNGEVTAYSGTTHWFDAPYIQLSPFDDSTVPGGVYVLAICWIGMEGATYPVMPSACKYDSFMVK